MVPGVFGVRRWTLGRLMLVFVGEIGACLFWAKCCLFGSCQGSDCGRYGFVDYQNPLLLLL